VQPNTPRLDVTLADITPTQVGLFEQQYRIELRAQNPTDAPIAIDGFAYELELNGKPFARGVSDEHAVVPRYGQVLLTATAVSSLSGLVQQIRSFASGFSGDMRYRVKGNFSRADGGLLPFDQRGEIGFH
jgi:LEA14-like dessication related protein